MTSWATITLKIDSEELVYDQREDPTGIAIDSGIDEQGWIDDETYYALSFGRYQDRRFTGHLEDLHCPKFSGVSVAVVTHAEDTGDTAKVSVYVPRQLRFEEREDGYERVETTEGSRWPEDERNELKDHVESLFGIEPVVEPQQNTIPPDMILRGDPDA